MVQVTNATKYHIIELLLVHDGSNVFLSQYGEMFTSSSLGTFDAEIVTGNLNIKFTPTLSLSTLRTTPIKMPAGKVSPSPEVKIKSPTLI